MRLISETAKRLGKTFDLKSHKNGYTISVALALLIAAILFGTYCAMSPPDQEGYMTIYLLDAQKKAINYPELIVNSENSTFSVYVEVENHMGQDQSCTVQVKVTKGTNPSVPVYGVNPINTYTEIVRNEGIWNNSATISLDQYSFGTYMLVFELWTTNENGVLQFSQNYCVLNVQVIDQIIP